MVSKMHYRMKSKLHNMMEQGDVTVHFFIGDEFVTVSCKNEMHKFKTILDGVADVRLLTSTPELLQRTKQYRVMTTLGFVASENGVQYRQKVKGEWVSIVFIKGKIKEIKVGDKLVDHYTLLVEGM